MAKKYEVPVLPGDGVNDYARYMRTDALLALQRRPEEMVHRDELLFQTVHQTTELWLKHACFEVTAAGAAIRDGALDTASRLLGRAALGLVLVSDQLDMLHHLTPWDFQKIRTILGHGSGLESPGWREVQRTSAELSRDLDDVLALRAVDLVALYQGSPDDPLYRLVEAMVEWDERVSVWRVRHYKIATRIVGHQMIGTKGMPVDALSRLISHKLFPQLWRVRTDLTAAGPMSQPVPVHLR
jgi:tryptophan 2,3-dioxygenase